MILIVILILFLIGKINSNKLFIIKFYFSLLIKHNNLKKYFNDYNEFYPPGLSFELAIQVFWRTKHLTESKIRLFLVSYFDSLCK